MVGLLTDRTLKELIPRDRFSVQGFEPTESVQISVSVAQRAAAQFKKPLPRHNPPPPFVGLGGAHVLATFAHVNEPQAVRNLIGRQQIEDLVHGGGGGH